MKLSFGLNKKELFRIWKAYNTRLADVGNPRDAVARMQRHPDLYPDASMNYFTALGFEIFNQTYLDGWLDGKQMDQPKRS